MTDLPKLASFWTGHQFSFFEYVCMKSYLDAGHDVTLYHIGDVGTVPEGLRLVDSREIYDPEFEIGPGLRHNNAVYADIFRLWMIKKTGAVWIDSDCICVRPHKLDSDYYFGKEEAGGKLHIANGVLGLPSDSEALIKMLELISTPNPIPPFFRPKRQRRLQERRDLGESFGFQDYSWGSSGPRLVTHFLNETGEVEQAQEREVFYPGPRPFRKPLLRADFPIEKLETPITLSVHIYGKTKRFFMDEYNGVLEPGCYLDVICQRHGVDPSDLPVIV